MSCIAERVQSLRMPAENVTCDFCVAENCEKSIWFFPKPSLLDAAKPKPSATICTQIVDIEIWAPAVQTPEWRMRIFHFDGVAVAVYSYNTACRGFFCCWKNTILLFFVVSGWFFPPFQWRANQTRNVNVCEYTSCGGFESNALLCAAFSQSMWLTIKHVFISIAFRPVSFRVREVIANNARHCGVCLGNATTNS